MSERNKEIVRKVNTAMADGNIEGFLSLCADEVKWTIVGDRTSRGKDSIRNWIASMDEDPPTFTVNNILADGNFVTVYGDMKMRDKDGKTTPYTYCDIYRFERDKIVELTSFVVKSEGKFETGGRAL